MRTPAHDPIVAEVRGVREQHAARFGFDVAAIFRDIREWQRNSGQKLRATASSPGESASETETGVRTAVLLQPRPEEKQ